MQEILREGRLYEVGGWVRDSLLTRSADSKDRDYLVCGIPLDRLAEILQRHGRVDMVGRSFGVIKFTPYAASGIPAATIDISLPRREYSTGVGHTDFAVDFDPGLSVEEDLQRRDFTINAMARDVQNGTLVDPYGGQRDLGLGLIRMVAPNSFAEDPLRMLRAVQFAARFEFQLEPATYQTLTASAALIASVSPERIADELNKMLLRAVHPSLGLRLMQQTGLMHYILPEMEATVGCDQPGGYHAYDVFEHTVRIVDACPPRLHLRLAALFHDITKPHHKVASIDGASFYGHDVSGAEVAGQVLKRLRYSTDIIKDVELLIERHMFTSEVGPKGLRRFIRRIGQRLIPDLLDLRRADVIAQGMGGTTADIDQMEQAIREEIERKPPFGRSDLAVNGDTIKTTFHLEPSPLIGDIIDYLMEKVLDDPAENQSERLLQLAGEYLKRNNADNIVQ